MKTLNKSVLVAFIIFTIVSCGKHEDRNERSVSSADQWGLSALSFSCNNLQCNAKSEYCLESKSESGNLLTFDCEPLPESCNGDKDCIIADAKDHFKDTNNCLGFISWKQDGDAITVTCHAPL